ncbi:MAG: glycoside hydrolase family 28 protein, partial [Lachnospiraceae bacterium]|nr:glycoside hydrolase family 28 protein [Lachnospiraceae bacterium]
MVIEMENDEAYEMEQEVTVSVIPTDASAKAYNHRSAACPAKARTCTTKRNVISLDGLLPQSDYCVTVTDAAGKETVHEFRTKPESVLLDIRRFGAVGDGVHDDTAAIQAAILACPPQGTVQIPPGIWRCTPIFLKSEMTLWLEEGATILGETDRAKIPTLPGMTRTTDEEGEYNLTSWEGNPLDTYASLITALSVHDTDIIGRGVIDGNAPAGDWWTDPKKKRTAWRPKTVFLAYCRNIRMCGVRVQNSPCWTIHPYYSDELGFYDLTIRNPPDSPNTDGLDPESCKQVEVLGTLISVGDD